MKENKKRKDYLQPDVSILSIDEESHLLAESPQVRPGGGGSGSQTQEQLTWFHIHQTIITLTTTWRVKQTK